MHSFYPILFVSFISSGIGFLSQTLISGFWATTFSDDVLTFSIGIAAFFLGMGGASLYARRIKTPLKSLFIYALFSSVYLGLSIPLLKLGIEMGANHLFLPSLLTLEAGILSGFAVPLALNALQGKTELGTLFCLDYIAAILFSYLFTFILLVPYGYQKTAFGVSLGTFLCLFVTALSLKVFSIRESFYFLFILGCSFTLQIFIKVTDPSVIYQKQTHYQKIVLTEIPDPLFKNAKTHHLYLDGFLQFSGEDEQIYHACLVNIPMSAVSYSNHISKKVLILGGGDGLAVRNVLQNALVESIDLVELDPEMIKMAKENPVLLKYNNRSLLQQKVNIIEQDAFTWVGNTRNKYDLIIIDFPAPKNLTLARLFSLEFYRKVRDLLDESGFISIQAGPSYSFSDENGETLSEVTTSIEKTLQKLGLKATAYVASKDSEAFVLAWKNSAFEMDEFAKKIGLYQENGMGSLCTYRANWKRPAQVEINTLNTLPISRYMLDWFRNRQGSFFVYRGTHAVFLPE